MAYLTMVIYENFVCKFQDSFDIHIVKIIKKKFLDNMGLYFVSQVTP